MQIYAMDIDWKRDNENLVCIEGVYLHGALERINGYDIIAVDKETAKEFDSMQDGFYPVTVRIGNHWLHSNMYYWHTTYSGTNKRHHRGLIVEVNDEYAEAYAKQKFEERSENI